MKAMVMRDRRSFLQRNRSEQFVTNGVFQGDTPPNSFGYGKTLRPGSWKLSGLLSAGNSLRRSKQSSAPWSLKKASWGSSTRQHCPQCGKITTNQRRQSSGLLGTTSSPWRLPIEPVPHDTRQLLKAKRDFIWKRYPARLPVENEIEHRWCVPPGYHPRGPRGRLCCFWNRCFSKFSVDRWNWAEPGV